jgi:predicted dehydrogenase
MKGVVVMKLRLIQVGLGGMGTGVGIHCVLPSNDFEYVGLVEINEKRLLECSNIFNVPKERCYTSYKIAFKELEADAVLVSAISPVHYEICKAALESNLHVLVEKPFVLNIDEAYELVRIASNKNLKLMVNQNYRFIYNVLTLKEAILEKKLGNPLFVHTQFYYNHDGKPYQREMKDYMLMEMAVHHIDMMRFLFDCNIKSVNGKTWNMSDSGYVGDPNVHAYYEMEKGIPISYFGSLISKGIDTPWEGNWRIQCEEGAIHLDDLGQGYGVYLVDAKQDITKMEYTPPTLDGVHGVLADWAKSIREDGTPSISGEDNIRTLTALFATSESSRKGKVVDIPDVDTGLLHTLE